MKEFIGLTDALARVIGEMENQRKKVGEFLKESNSLTSLELTNEVKEEKMTSQQARQADELFIAVTTQDIVGVVEFDKTRIGDGSPGRYTKMLTDQFRLLTV